MALSPRTKQMPSVAGSQGVALCVCVCVRTCVCAGHKTMVIWVAEMQGPGLGPNFGQKDLHSKLCSHQPLVAQGNSVPPPPKLQLP